MTYLNRYLYHFTHISNFESILKNKGLYSNNLMKVHGLHYKDIAQNEIQTRRSATLIPVPPFGNLHDYVPFYFGIMA
ncbi:DarT ssDNA thymidine ADP-ribosyltransferase family protein [Aquibacillus salsiterrae]|uniref:DUF4433 domain-containing protein n=1 Tax=Aquibacillus salsiterrae TaxID=2950439 RepID=A0A9X4AG32_9BACI|nr:DarT ssDNA thymidine ADP-ribosyltransferase family protein [Aquibacillus salsiterrae]MDC3416678.1 DUF4433 domain-containing protein [Aquibacillus salsiterrae]